MSSKISNTKELIKENGLDALFVTGQENVTYLTGFKGLSQGEREGFLFITKYHSYLLTFPTYYGLYCQGKGEMDTLNITTDKKLHHHLTEIIQREKISLIGVEKEHLTLSEFSSLKRKIGMFQATPPSRLISLKPKVKLIQTENIIEKLRSVKDGDEIASIRKAANITDQAYQFIRTKIRPRISEKTLALELEFFLKKNADDTAFSPIVAFNAGSAIPHYLPSNDQRLKTNSLILLDFGAKVDGYCSDMTRVIFFCSPTNELVNIYNTVLEAQKLALKNLKPGEKCAEIDIIAKNYIRSKDYPQYPHGLGHGVGLAIHEAPRLKKDSKDLLKENMVVTVEPGIYIEGKYGIRIEDLVVLTHTGVEVLTKSSKEITVI